MAPAPVSFCATNTYGFHNGRLFFHMHYICAPTNLSALWSSSYLRVNRPKHNGLCPPCLDSMSPYQSLGVSNYPVEPPGEDV